MKLSKNLGKEHAFLLVLLLGSCLVLDLYYSQPQAFWHFHNLNWKKMELPGRDVQEKGTTTVSNNTDVDARNQSGTNVTVDYNDKKVQEAIQSGPICDFSDWRSDICNMTGDIRTQGYNISTVFYVPPPDTFMAEKQWSVNAYSQKKYMYFSKNVTVKQSSGPQYAPLCTVDQSNAPAILISLGGPTGNIWHDFTDVIIPLVLAAKPLNREVQFLIINYQQWFVDKFGLILKNLSRYNIINFDEDKEIRCYWRMLVGLLNHKAFGIDPNRAFDGFNMFKFRIYIRSIYSLPMDVDIPYKMDKHSEKKPRLLLVGRSKSRRFLNQEEIVEVIKKTGFEIVVVEPSRNDNLTEMSKLVDSCDVLMGVHGAALTNIIFLRTNALMLQVVPLGGNGMEEAATSCYNGPADEMKLRRIDYYITPEESSLLEKYGWDDPVINDPESISRKGWQIKQQHYWNEQNVRLNVTRFEPVLVRALKLLKE